MRLDLFDRFPEHGSHPFSQFPGISNFRVTPLKMAIFQNREFHTFVENASFVGFTWNFLPATKTYEPQLYPQQKIMLFGQKFEKRQQCAL